MVWSDTDDRTLHVSAWSEDTSLGRLTKFPVPVMIHPWTPTTKKSIVPIALETSSAFVAKGVTVITSPPFDSNGPGKLAKGWK